MKKIARLLQSKETQVVFVSKKKKKKNKTKNAEDLIRCLTDSIQRTVL